MIFSRVDCLVIWSRSSATSFAIVRTKFKVRCRYPSLFFWRRKWEKKVTPRDYQVEDKKHKPCLGLIWKVFSFYFLFSLVCYSSPFLTRFKLKYDSSCSLKWCWRMTIEQSTLVTFPYFSFLPPTWRQIILYKSRFELNNKNNKLILGKFR